VLIWTADNVSASTPVVYGTGVAAALAINVGTAGSILVNGGALVGTTLSASGTATMAAINASGTVAMAGAATVGTTLGVTGTSTMAAINASGAITATPSISIGSTANEWTGAPSAVNPLIQSNGTTSFGTISAASSRADGTSFRIGSFTGEYQTNSVNHKTIGVMDFVTTGTTANQRGGGWNLSLKADGSTSTTTVISATVAGGVSVTGTLGVTGIITAKGAAYGANTSTFNSAAADFSLATQNSHATSPYGHAIKYTAAAPNTTGDASTFFYMADSSAVRAYFSSNGGLANYSANNTNLSDIRTKKDIQPAGAYLSKIMAIPVKTFLYKDQTDTSLNLGVIAQDVEAVAPELIDNSGFGEIPEDGIPLKTIYQTDFQYALMKALQELAADFQAYKSSHP